jgi:sulfur-oxidizing protein SoxY
MRILFAATVLLALAGGSAAMADDDDARSQAERWHEVSTAIFGSDALEDGSAVLKLTVPVRAMDAALVPISVELTGAKQVATLSLVVDNNPAPLVGTFHLGPAFAQRGVKLRVRVNNFTLVHAVAKADDGTLYAVGQYVKAAGGCSSPSAGESAETLARIGKMQLRRTRLAESAEVPAQLLISHPNYNGMQRDPGTGGYTPPRYLKSVSVSVGGARAFDFESGISLSEDPAISFTYEPRGDGVIDVIARDSSSAVFSQHFDAMP